MFRYLVLVILATPAYCPHSWEDSDGVSYDDQPMDTDMNTPDGIDWRIQRYWFRVYNGNKHNITIKNITFLETLENRVVYEDSWYDFFAPPHNYSYYCIFKPRDPENSLIKQEFAVIFEYLNKTYYTPNKLQVRILPDDDDYNTLEAKFRKGEFLVKTKTGAKYTTKLELYTGLGPCTFTTVPFEVHSYWNYWTRTYPWPNASKTMKRKTKLTTKTSLMPN